MSGLQPLTANSGQIEAIGGRRLEVKKLNLGPEQLIVVTSSIVTIFASHHLLANAGNGVQNVDTFLGGEEGDLLVLKGEGIRLRAGDNIQLSSNYRLEPGKTIVLLFAGGVWLELSRTTT